jgi:hypothetical protein
MHNSEQDSPRKEIRTLQFFDFHRCSTVEWPLLGLSLSVDELASRIDAPVQNWIEDGLGPAKGFVVRLPSSLIVGVEEMEQYDGRMSGASVIVDSAELAIVGPEKLIKEAKEGLQLSDSEIVHSATIEDRAKAAELVRDIMVKVIQGSQQKISK